MWSKNVLRGAGKRNRFTTYIIPKNIGEDNIPLKIAAAKITDNPITIEGEI